MQGCFLSYFSFKERKLRTVAVKRASKTKPPFSPLREQKMHEFFVDVADWDVSILVCNCNQCVAQAEVVVGLVFVARWLRCLVG